MEVRVRDSHSVPLVDEDLFQVVAGVTENYLTVFGAREQQVGVKRTKLYLVNGASVNLFLHGNELLSRQVEYHYAAVIASNCNDAFVKLVEANRTAHKSVAKVS